MRRRKRSRQNIEKNSRDWSVKQPEDLISLILVTGPTAPEKIRAEVENNDLTIHWQEPKITNGPMQDYVVYYTDDPSLPEDQWQTASSGGATELRIPNLKENTEYTFRVKGKNVNGDGLTSKDQTATTWLKRKHILEALFSEFSTSPCRHNSAKRSYRSISEYSRAHNRVRCSWCS